MEGIMGAERASTPGDTRMSRACRTYQFITSVVYAGVDRKRLYLSLCKPPLLVCRTHLVRAK